MGKLIILVGLPGSGKSSYAESLQAAATMRMSSNIMDEVVIHSSDAIRGELFGDPGSQENNALVFETMHKRVKEDLRAGKTVIYDATNITRKARKGAIALASANDILECHIVWAPVETCFTRDAGRDRKVGYAVIDKMLRRWQSPDKSEGFSHIQIINSDEEFDNVRYISSITASMQIPHDNPHHTANVWEHSIGAYRNLINSGDAYIPKAVLQAAYWHDLGKPYTKFYKKKKDSDQLDTSCAHYYDHQNVGAYLAYGLYLNPQHQLYEGEVRDICYISWLINNHMEPFFNSKYFNSLSADERYWINQIHIADLAAH